ncbi:hypothetical protein K3495_g6745 [Podosphaera aphanis]|nr:hypothetical protein K3495_g6745 [Podosphaera aphanis]
MNRNSLGSENSVSPSSFLSSSINNHVFSIVDDLSTRLDFNSLEDLHSTLLTAAQAEHARVRERAQRLLELEQIRYEKDRLKNAADAAEERFRVETAKEAEARRIRHAEHKTRKFSKSISTANVQHKSSKIAKPNSVEPTKSKPVETAKHKEEKENKPKSVETVKPKSAQANTPIPVETKNSKPVEPGKLSLAGNDKRESLETFKLTSREDTQHIPSSPTQPRVTPAKKTPVLITLPLAPHALPAKPTSYLPAKSSNLINRPITNQSNQTASNANLSISKPIELKSTVQLSQSNVQNSYTEIPYYDAAKISRFREIHTQMKNVRRQIENQTDHDGNPTKLRSSCSSGRREITKALGQLVVGGKNTAIAEKVIQRLLEALQDTTQLVQLSLFTTTRHTTNLETNNVGIMEDQVPLAFIYLLGSLCKAICAQLVSEAALKPRAASPIGILAAKVFSNPRLLWRGKSLIDVLISKMFFVCPVLFGIRGDESTQEGRTQIGWRKLNGKFISEQAHFDRMIGIAAGYAAISLRDFSKSRSKNPYPPSNYWRALSAIVNTPSEQTFPTQFVVLKGLIEGHFPRFLFFYGDMAVAALQAALVEFPKRGAAANAAVGTLKTLGITLQKDHGLTLF